MKSQVLELVYGASLEKDGEGWLVTFRDLTNVFSGGKTRDEAIFNAQEALEGVLLEMVAEDLEIPLPSSRQPGEEVIVVRPEVAAPVMLHILRQQTGQTIATLAQALGVKYHTYQQMEKTGQRLTLKGLTQAAKALGATVELRWRKVG